MHQNLISKDGSRTERVKAVENNIIFLVLTHDGSIGINKNK